MRSAAVVGHHRGSAASGQVEVHARNPRFRADRIEFVRIVDAGDDQQLDLLRDQGFDDGTLRRRVALGADHHRAQSAPPHFVLECFGKPGEEAVPVVRNDHAGETRLLQTQSPRAKIDIITKPVRGFENSLGCFWVDPVTLPGAVQDETDRRGRSLRSRRYIIYSRTFSRFPGHAPVFIHVTDAAALLAVQHISLTE